MRTRHIRFEPTLLIALLVCVACRRSHSSSAAEALEWSDPQRVAILGYRGDAMEPFLSRDGRYLFFNNLNEPKVNTNLHWAQRLDDLTFQYKGELQCVNTAWLEGVPSMDRDGNFYFVSNRSYDQTASTLYRGHFSAGNISSVELIPGVSVSRPGIVNFDAEISADGNTLYFVESQFSRTGQPKTAVILFARKKGSTFVRDDASNAMLRSVNGFGLDYAPATSPSELEIFFTRADQNGPVIYTARRTSLMSPFGEEMRIRVIDGFAEAPTLSPDGKSLYYHRRDGDHFVLYRVSRK